MVTDPKLAEHLSHFGINIMQMQKTEKSMAEMQIELNFEFQLRCNLRRWSSTC